MTIALIQSRCACCRAPLVAVTYSRGRQPLDIRELLNEMTICQRAIVMQKLQEDLPCAKPGPASQRLEVAMPAVTALVTGGRVFLVGAEQGWDWQLPSPPDVLFRVRLHGPKWRPSSLHGQNTLCRSEETHCLSCILKLGGSVSPSTKELLGAGRMQQYLLGYH